jgi:hypothetical protein
MAPIIAINPKLGKVRYLNDYDPDANDDYAKWERPLKVHYMRFVK